MCTGRLAKHSLFVMFTIVVFAGGDVLARGKGGGGGSGRGGGGGSGRSASSSSSRGGGGGSGRSSYAPPRRSSFSGGGSSRSQSYSGGSSLRSSSGGSSRSSSPQFNRSYSRSSGDSGRSSWSSGGTSWSGGSNRSQRSAIQSRQFNPGNSNDQSRSNSIGRFYGSSPSGNSLSEQMRSYRARQSESDASSLRSWNGQNDNRVTSRRSENGQVDSSSIRGSSRSRYTAGKPSSEELQAFFEQRRGRSSDNVQTSATQSDRRSTFRGGESSFANPASRENDRNRFSSDFSNRSGRQITGGQNQGAGDNDVRGRGDGARFSDDRERFRNGNFDNSARGRNANESYRDFANRSRDGDGRGGARRGDWSNWSKDGDRINPKTARWYGKSGFGDHRGRSDRHGGDRDSRYASQVRRNWNDNWWNKHDRNYYHDRHHIPFAFAWWAGRSRAPYFYYWQDFGWRNEPYYWWHTCSAPLLTTWVDFGWNYPCYWDYGPGEYISYYQDTVYVDGHRYATSLDYYAQVRGLARSVPTLTQDQLAGMEWLPLGVFAVTRPGEVASNELVQLAVSKDGVLSGTWFDQESGTARPLQGMVEQETQRAAWCFADAPNEGLVVETSVYNLTEQECTALAHLGPVTTEYWQLVRLEQPAQPAAPAPPNGQPLPAPK